MKLFDIETDGFLDKATRIHCLVVKDVETGIVWRYYHDPQGHDHSIEDGLYALMKVQERGEYLCGLNVIKFDIPVIQKLYPWFKINERLVLDLLVLSRLIFTDMGDRDNRLMSLNKKREVEHRLLPATFDENGDEDPPQYEEVLIQEEFTRFPGKLWGRHSLKAWGWRLGILKGTYAEDSEEEDAWAVFTPEMLDYCVQDVEVTHVLYTHLTSSEYSPDAIELEHLIAWICARMERSGWPFNVPEAAKLYAQLVLERDKIRVEMLETFKPVVIERWSTKTGKRLKDKVIEFNPGSRQQIAERLVAKYGWKPTEYTESGQVKVDEDILKKLDYPEAKLLANYFLLDKRIGQIAEGDQAWLKCERNGHIHGSVNTNGAVTGRCTHAAPNLAQVPSVQAVWGVECRRLFTVRPGFRMVGADLSGLELRCLAHFMSKWDGGEYANEVLNGDVHTKNQIAAGLPSRANAKTFIYAYLYGAGDEKIGSIVGKGRKHGRMLKERFLEQTPALKKLKKAVSQAAKRGHLMGIDGRRLHIRSEHAALNTLLQSAGALISKRWVIEVFIEAEKRGYRYGWDGDFTMLGYVHDEAQMAVRDGLHEEFGQMMVDCAVRAGTFFKFKCPIAAEYKVGMNWFDTH